MKKTYSLLLTLLIALATHANDGVYIANGSLVYPMQETNISMEKEVLTFTVNSENELHVHVDFDFYNPDTLSRSLLIGFQVEAAPRFAYNYKYKGFHIKDFTVEVNGENRPYTINYAKCADCPLKELGEERPQPEDYSKNIYVFLFEAEFNPGMNKVIHSYTSPGSDRHSRCYLSMSYHYILTTGAKWADRTIKDLTINFDFGPNEYYYVADIFGKTAEWSFTGIGKIAKKIPHAFGTKNNPYRMIRVMDGIMQIKIKDYEPKTNIHFGKEIRRCFFNNPEESGDPENYKIGHTFLSMQLYENQEYTLEELRLIRNMVYAQHGYVFKDKKLNAYFRKLDWYIPLPELKMSDIQLNYSENKLIGEVLEREREMQGSEE